jgi:hypothetical protein
MTSDSNPNPPAPGSPEPQSQPEPAPKTRNSALLNFPGLVAIGLYMFLLAGGIVLYVVQGYAGPLFLVFPVLFIAGGLGLLFLLRWAWALTLTAVTLLAAWYMWSFFTQHSPGFLVQALLNLVFFLYLVRTEVRAKLR